MRGLRAHRQETDPARRRPGIPGWRHRGHSRRRLGGNGLRQERHLPVRQLHAGYTSLSATWHASSGATGYQVTVTSHQAKITQTTVTGTSYRLGHLKQKTSYGVHVLALPQAPGQKAATVYTTTK